MYHENLLEHLCDTNGEKEVCRQQRVSRNCRWALPEAILVAIFLIQLQQPLNRNQDDVYQQCMQAFHEE